MGHTLLHRYGGALAIPAIVGTDPSTLPGLELYLDSRLGVGAATEGSPLSSWLDQSGHVRNAGAAGGASTLPTYRTTTNLSPKGQPTVEWNGEDNALSSATFNWPAETSGYTYHWYGRTITKTAPPFSFVNAIGWQKAGLPPSLTWNTGGAPQSYGLIDSAGGGNPHRFGTAASVNGLYRLFSFVLPAPNGGVTPMLMYVDGVLVAQSAGPVNWNVVGLSGGGPQGYVIGNASGFNVGYRGNQGWLAWYSRTHTAAIISAISIWTARVWGYT